MHHATSYPKLANTDSMFVFYFNFTLHTCFLTNPFIIMVIFNKSFLKSTVERGNVSEAINTSPENSQRSIDKCDLCPKKENFRRKIYSFWTGSCQIVLETNLRLEWIPDLHSLVEYSPQKLHPNAQNCFQLSVRMIYFSLVPNLTPRGINQKFE